MGKTVFKMACGMLALLFLAASAPERANAQEGARRPAPRTWTARTGKSKVLATFVEVKDGKVCLRKADGTIARTPIEMFSDADQEYVRKQTGTAEKPDAAPSEGPTKEGAGAGSPELEQQCQRLCDQITKSYKGKDTGGKATVAVVEFSDLSGGVSNLGRFLSEELITKLFSTGNYQVIERLLLNKVIAEHKLQFQGMVDPKSAKELGSILGVDAVVCGTIADLGNSFRVNARLISTETGQVLSVAAATVTKDETIIALTGGGGAGGEPAHPDGPREGKLQPVQLPFREDFSKYKDDERTDWGRGVKVRTGADGRKWLVASAKGQHPVGRNVDLPPNAYIEFEYSVEMLESRRPAEDKVLSGITLVDEAGAKYRMEWTVRREYRYWGHYLALPGGASVHKVGLSPEGTLRIRKTGDTITVIIGREKLTGNTRDFKTFKRFEVDVYRGPNATISFTNFKIGTLQ